jgi:general secretion pathway protein D
MLFKRAYLFSLGIVLTQFASVLPSYAADKPVIINDNKTGVKPMIRFDYDPNININLSNAVVGDVLKALADQVGHNLVINTDAKAVDDVIPRIEFNNIKLSEAMSFILRLKNLTVRKINKTLFVTDDKQLQNSGIDDSIIKTYHVGNLKPTEAVIKITEFYTGGAIPPKLISSDQTNTIVAIGRPTEIDYLDSVIKIVDGAVPQVMIEIKLIELNEIASRSLGFSYGFGQRQFGAAFNNTTVPAPAANTGAQPISAGGLTLSFDALRNFTSNFNVQINALVQNSKAKILSNPRIAAQNGKPAIFTSTESVPIVTTTQTAAGQTQNVSQLAIGETINVTPLLIDPSSGYVTLLLNPIIGSRGKDVIVNGNPVPETLNRSVNTTMKVRSGEAIVIGGLKRKNNTTASNKIPILGDIPFIGALFGANSWSDGETELIIMVTPYILDESGNVPKTEVSSGL